MLVEKFEAQVKRSPGNIAVKTDSEVFTYAELNRYADAIARQISEHTSGKTVGLLFEHGVHMIAAILGALKAGKIYVPLSVDYPAARISYMLTDSQSSLVLTNATNLSLAEELSAQTRIPMFTIHPAENFDQTVELPARTVSGDDTAYILYTSGSTGKPKGVYQTRRNADYYNRNWVRIFSITSSDRMTLFSSFCHDGSVQDMFSALYSGAALYPMNMKNRENTMELSEFLVKERITIWHSVPSLFSYFANTLNGNETFPHLRFILLGGEPVRKHEADLLKRFFPHCTMANVYGQTESSVNSICLIRPDTGYDKPKIGMPLDETQIFVIDEDGDPVEPLETGEIVVGCKYISPGYWKNPEATQKVFAPDEELGRLYWTGDLGRLLLDGSIEFLGRRDLQIKIRGFRVELGEIETRLLKHEDIKEAVVTAGEDKSGDKFLSAYIVTAGEENKLNVTQLRQFIARELPDYMVPAFFVFLDKMPLTPNGKIDRKSLPEPRAMEPGEDYVAPRDEVEEELTVIWADVLGVQKEHIGIDADFFQMGGHSLKATIVTSKIHKALGVSVPLAVIFKFPTIRGLTQYIKNAAGETYMPLEKAPIQEYYPLTSPQRRLYVLQQLDGSGTGYNLPAVVELEGHLNIEKLEGTFREMIFRHESFRTSFRMIAEQTVQEIHEEVPFAIEHYDLAAKNAKEREEKEYDVDTVISQFIRAFDLAQAPLLRVGLVNISKERYILMMDMHHIITDGISIEIFIKEFMALYAGEILPPLRFQYRDYAVWRDSNKQQEILKGQENYWLELFKGEIPVLNLPCDFPRPAVQRFEGRSFAFELGAEETGSLKGFALAQGVTMYMLLLSLLNAWLSRLSGQEDIVIGTPIAGRRHADLERVIGMFVNTLALRNRPTGDKTFAEFLEQLKENTLEAFENQEYQFDDLVEKITLQRDTSRNPLFDVMFMLRNFDVRPGDIPVVEIEELTLKPYPFERKNAKFDLDVTASETSDRLLFNIEYSSNLFKEETVQRFAGYFKTLVNAVLRDPQVRLSGIEILSPEDKKTLISDFNNTVQDYPVEKTVHQLFEEQVEKTPDRIAMVAHSLIYKSNKTYMIHLTYKELNAKADSLASHLTTEGVTAGQLVGLLVTRSSEMMIGILGILKAGGAYLPLDPDYPEKRINYILRHSGLHILLTESRLEEKLRRISFPGELIDLHDKKNYPGNAVSRGNRTTSQDPAYVIYTSGSTGNPKGVTVRHYNVVNLLKGLYRSVDYNRAVRILALTTISFDIFVTETLFPLAWGMETVIADEQMQLDSHLLAEAVVKHRIDILQLTPSRLKLLFNSGRLDCLEKVKSLIVGGEAFPAHLLKELSENFPGRIYNGYGPTEGTVWTSFKELKVSEAVTIGFPVANVRLYVVDRYNRLQPPGIAGELLIGGDGLAAGYINNPELTAEKFNQDFQDYQDYQEKNKTKVLRGPGAVFQKSPWPPEARIYRTGDLARWLPGGELDFLGRIDSQLKIRGFRIEPEEIEERLLNDGNVKEAVVVDRIDGSGEKYLCAYIVPYSRKKVDNNSLREHLSQSLPDYMVPAFFVTLDRIPLTPNGKIDRKALPAPDVALEDKVVSPRNPIEQRLAVIWAGVLERDKKSISIDADFFKMGGHSLKATIVAAKIHEAFNILVPLAQLFKTSTIRSLARYLKTAVESIHVPLSKAPRQDYYPLSSPQRRMYMVRQFDENSAGYNLPAVVELTGNLNVPGLEKAFRTLIDRHESLRTSFHMIGEEPVQRIHDETAFTVEYFDLAAKNAKEHQEKGHDVDSVISQFIRPFDLMQTPLLRVGLINTGEGKYILMLDMHHIITDGISIEIFIKELMVFYSGESLPPLRFQYKDYAVWRNSASEQEALKWQEKYWLEVFEGEIPVLELPYDFPRPAVQSFAGCKFEFEITPEEAAALKEITFSHGATLYMLLLAVVNVWLAKLSSQDDIVVGTPIAGRRHVDLEGVIGMFVNTLALRNRPFGNMTFGKFLNRVKQNTLEAFENQDYQLEDLVERVVSQRDMSRNPLFDVLFSLMNFDMQANPVPFAALEDLVLKPYPFERGIAKFDLTITAQEVSGRLAFTVEYCTHLFKEDSIRLFVEYFKRIISVIAGNPGVRLSEIELLTEDQRRKIFYYFNNTVVDYPYNKTIHQLFGEQVEKTPDLIAVAVHSGTHEVNRIRKTHMTYKELNTKSDYLSADLMARGLGVGDIAAIMGERSLEMVVGILGILKTGATYLPIDNDYPDERKHYMFEDSGAKILLTQQDLTDILTRDTGAVTCPAVPLQSSDPAYIMYTSGSTGRPRGVVVSHRNVVRLVKNTNFIELGEETRVLQTGAPVFDAVTFEMWGPLLNGGLLVVTGKDVILDAYLLGEALKEFTINTLWLSSPLFNQLMLQNIELFEPLKYLLVGGDVLSLPHINRVRERFPELKVINGYGPTENTTFSTTHLIEKEYEYTIPIGRPIANSSAYIMNRDGHLLPLGVWGELVVGGDGVSMGYLNNPELTAEKYTPLPLPTSAGTPGPFTPLYHTGDLARWLPDGSIEFKGRIDQQVKIRGFRIELEEIETRLLKHQDVKEAVMIARTWDNAAGDKYLCAYVVPHSTFTGEDSLRRYLSAQLPDYMVPAHFVVLEEIPLTPNGKVDKRALPMPESSAGDNYTAPRDRAEEIIARIWADVLSKKPDIIGIDNGFFELGGHSLKATIVAAKLHEAFNIRVPLAQLFKTPTIRGLARYLKAAVQDVHVPLEKAPRQEYYPLSSPQRRMFMVRQFNESSTGYNLPAVVELTGNLNIPGLEEAFRILIDRHESLRTSFHMIGEDPVQKIHDGVEFQVEYVDLAAKNAKEREEKGHDVDSIISQFIRPFDLMHAPLLRVGLIKNSEEGKYILMLDMHHIITDGMSIEIFIKELMALYAGETLPPMRFQYKDYAVWRNSTPEQEALKWQEKYWFEVFAGEVPVLELPYDFPRPAVQRFEGSRIEFGITSEETSHLKEISLSHGVTLYMLFLSILNVWLSKLSSQEDIVVGTPVAGRRHVDLEGVIGMFVNTLALRNHPIGTVTFSEFLNRVKQNTLEAFENQDYQFEDLVEQVAVQRDMSRNPLFDVMFSLLNFEIQVDSVPVITADDFELKPYSFERGVAKFDLTFTAFEKSGQLLFSIEYSTDLFKDESIRRFIEYYKKIISVITRNPRILLAEIDLLSEAEQREILFDFNNTAAAYPYEKTVLKLFEEQVEKTPGHVAVVAPSGTHESERTFITYKALSEKSDNLASYLVERGVGVGDIVAIMGERSLEIIVGIMGILKAGAGYLPIDPDYPEERKQYMLADSAAKMLLTQQDAVDFETLDTTAGKQHVVPVQPSDLAYVIYTSGTAGKPKGTMIQHCSLVNLCTWHNSYYGITGKDNVTQYASLGFDASVWEIFPALITGAALHIIASEIRIDMGALNDYFERNHITVSFLPTPVCQQFMEQENRSLRVLLTGGDKLLHFIKRKYQLYNNYGPTENTVVTTSGLVEVETGNISIGKPIANTRIYILDKACRLPQPVGVPGELCVAGDSLSMGYLNNPELTAERFFTSLPLFPSTPLYRTGDLARWLPDGSIEFNGRIDQQVKIRGFRIELEEIENRLLKHEEVKEAVVIARAGDNETGDKYLCAYIVPHAVFAGEESLRGYLAAQLPDYMIPAYFVILEEIPLTPNGKVDKRALPMPELSARENYIAPRDEVEETMVQLWAEALAKDKEIIGIDDGFFDLGGHSLKAVMLTSKLHKAFDVKVPLSELFRLQTIRRLSEWIKGSRKTAFVDIVPVEQMDYYQLSYNQKRLWIIQQVNPDDTSYNMPGRFTLEHEVDVETVRKSLAALIQRHESFRTAFIEKDGEPFQVIEKTVDVHLELNDISSLEDSEKQRRLDYILAEEAQTPFDLRHPPLFRVRLVKWRENRWEFIFSMHHIISDGWSQEIVKRDFSGYYDGFRVGEEVRLEPLPLQYKDFAAWQNRQIESPQVKELSHRFWLSKIKQGLSGFQLPYDYNGDEKDAAGLMYRSVVDKEIKEKMKQLAARNNTTLFIVMFSAYNWLLSQYSGQEDIVCNIISAGREHAALQDIVGFFINSIAAKTKVDFEESFDDFLHRVDAEVMELFQNQGYPMELVLDELKMPYPEISVSFNMLNMQEGSLESQIKDFEPSHSESKWDAKFALVLHTMEYANGIELNWVYKKSLFDPGTMELLSKGYMEMLKLITGATS